MKTVAYLYRWTHTPTAKWYVGSRTAKGCHPDDGYLCSSNTVKPMIIDNPSEWERDILVIGESKFIRNLERAYLLQQDAKNNPLSFNKTNADTNFGIPGMPLSNDVKKKISSSLTGKTKGPMSLQHKQNLSASKKGRTAWNKGKKMSDEYRQSLSLSHIGTKRTPHSDQARSKISLALRGRTPWNKGLKKGEINV